MTINLTPAEKRKLTLERRLGADWRKAIGKSAKAARQAKNGDDGYKAQQAKAGVSGGSKHRPNTRPFKTNRKLAKAAGAKRAEKMWEK